MGQKINPTGFRLGVLNGWRSNWFSQRDFAGYLDEDRLVLFLVPVVLELRLVLVLDVEDDVGVGQVDLRERLDGRAPRRAAGLFAR